MQPDPLLQQDIGSYRLIECIGKGGMGTVYLGRHPAIGKRVAIKVLNVKKTQDQDSIMRFFHEAKAVNEIGHPNLVDVLDFGETSSGLRYLIMEHLQGRALSALIQAAAPLPEAQICHIMTQLCSALSAAHEKGIIHRDLKPDNIFLCQRGDDADFVKLLDFGIAKISDAEGFELATAQGVVMGTPTHMAPEQALGQDITPAVDIYALGVILYQMATGLLPFYDSNRLALAMMHVRDVVPNPREKTPALSEELSAIILRCLEKDKDRRYPSMKALSEALPKIAPSVTPKPEVTLAPEPVKSEPAPAPKPASWLSWGVVGLLVIVLAVFWAQRPGSQPVVAVIPPTPPPATQPRPAIAPVITPTTQAATTQPESKEKHAPRVTKEPAKKKSAPAGTMTIDPFK